MKKYLTGVFSFFLILLFSISAYGIENGGKIYTPSFLSLGDSQITSEKASMKFRDGVLTSVFTYTIDNSEGEVTNLGIAVPRITGGTTALKMDGKTQSLKKETTASLTATYSGAKLLSGTNYYLGILEIKPGTKHTIVITTVEKYTKGSSLRLSLVPDENNPDNHFGSVKVVLDTGKLIPTDLGTILTGDKTLSSNQSGKATWSGDGAIPACEIQFSNSKEELIGVLGASKYKSPRSMSNSLIKNDMAALIPVAETYLVDASYQDPRLDMRYVREALVEAYSINKNYEKMKSVLTDISFRAETSDRLGSRILYRALEYAKTSGDTEIGKRLLLDFSTDKPEEYQRILPVLEKSGFTDKDGEFLVGNPSTETTVEVISLTPTPAPEKVGSGANTLKKAGFFSTLGENIKKSKALKISGYILVFLLGFFGGVIFSNRKRRGTGKQNRTVYIG